MNIPSVDDAPDVYKNALESASTKVRAILSDCLFYETQLDAAHTGAIERGGMFGFVLDKRIKGYVAVGKTMLIRWESRAKDMLNITSEMNGLMPCIRAGDKESVHSMLEKASDFNKINDEICTYISTVHAAVYALTQLDIQRMEQYERRMKTKRPNLPIKK